MKQMMKQIVAWLVGCAGILGTAAVVAQQGDDLYQTHCAVCHEELTDARVPSRLSLSRMNPVALLATLETGLMRIQAASISAADKRELVESLTRKKIADLKLPGAAFCGVPNAPVSKQSPILWSGWGGDAQASGYARAKRANLPAADVPKLTLKWAFAFPGVSQARSQPAVLGDVVYVGGAEGSLTALDAESGCIYWRINVAGAIRGAITVGEVRGGTRVLYAVSATTDVYAIDAVTGAVIWKQHAGFDPLHSVTGTPAYHAGRVYIPISSMEVGAAGRLEHECCKSSGGVVALDTQAGEIVWQMRSTLVPAKKFGESASGKAIYAPSGAPVWASPTVDAKRNLLYIGTGENYSRPTTKTSDAILALDLDTGKVVWSYQATPDDAWHGGCGRMPDYAPCDDPGPDFDFGMSPILVTPRGSDQEILVVGQKSAVVFALDPDQQGKVIWQRRVGKGSALGGIHWGMATDGVRVYVANADRPAIIRDVNPDTKLAPGMYALDIQSGEVLWQVPTPGMSCQPDPDADVAEQRARLRGCLTANSAAPSVIDGVVFAGDLNGVLRAYAADTGEVVWETNTKQAYEPINGITGEGGSIDGPGPVVANGRLFINSGYGSFGQFPGNVLLAFSLADEDKDED